MKIEQKINAIKFALKKTGWRDNGSGHFFKIEDGTKRRFFIGPRSCALQVQRKSTPKEFEADRRKKRWDDEERAIYANVEVVDGEIKFKKPKPKSKK